jgi:hypothetical protein
MRNCTTAPAAVLVAVIGFATPGCGTTGWIRFEALDARFSSEEQTPTAPLLETIDCEDYQSGEQPLLYPYFRKKILYVTTCTKDGAGIPWKVVGVFHAGSMAFDKWAKYSREVAEKARAQGCPGLLVRKAPPASGQEAHAIGAVCVDPARPSGVRGPLRLASISEEPLRILADDEPAPPPR